MIKDKNKKKLLICYIDSDAVKAAAKRFRSRFSMSYYLQSI